MKRLVEIRSYKLKPGTAEAFHAAVVGSAVLWLSPESIADLRRSNPPG